MYKRDRSGSFVPDKQLDRNAQYARGYRYDQQSKRFSLSGYLPECG